uniref:NinG recombination protein n=1 Tax=Siphoviridae sp. ct6d71 TaxID=2826298 RepID=A0A8S5R2M8_9CAUD|nr:MAG TPA: NinG recombination protein [Siphoviridae sp. ct6d71]
MIYVLNIEGQPLMPCKEAKARKLLKQNKAKIYKREPFTIQLLFVCENQTQDITLGVDAGSKHIGLSATTKEKELYAADVELRNDIVELLAIRRQNRRARRNRLRYRKPRFNNRVYSKKSGWLAPSVEQKIRTHFRVIEDIHKLLPITKIVVETASFDIQKIKNPEIHNEEYQQGEQLGFWNVREYVLFRDNHTCQCCKGKSKDKILNVHHIESKKTGGNAPNNLITLCETCHKGYHNGTVKLLKTIKRGMSFKDAAFMGIMRWSFYDRLKEAYPNVFMTYGYITKNTRVKCNLPKEHYIDARCISGNPNVEPLGYYFYQKKVRCHNRQIHKAKILKGGKKKMNQASYLVKGFRLFDKVEFDGQVGFIFGRRNSGYFDVRKLNKEVISRSASYKKLTFLETRKSLLIEKRIQGVGII